MTTPHLSEQALDALAAGRSTPERAAHLASCVLCQEQWATIEQVDAALRRSPRFGTTLQYVLRDVASARRARRLRLFVIAPLAAAAIAVVVILRPSFPGLRRHREATSRSVPAVASMRVVREEGDGPLRPGDRVLIQVEPAGARRALVMGFDEVGWVAQIWPPSGDESGLLPPGRSVRLKPGSWAPWRSTRVEVFLSNEPISAAAVRQAFKAARARNRETPVRTLALDPVPGQTGRLSEFVEVQTGSREMRLGAPR